MKAVAIDSRDAVEQGIVANRDEGIVPTYVGQAIDQVRVGVEGHAQT